MLTQAFSSLKVFFCLTFSFLLPSLMLFAPDVNGMKGLLRQLPKPFYDLCKYLFGFLHHMVQFKEVTKVSFPSIFFSFHHFQPFVL